MPEYVSFDQFRDRVHGAKLGDEVDRCYPEHETRAAVMNAARGASPVGGAGPVATSRPARREAFAAELDKMLGYLRRYYHAAGAAEHTFLDPGGNFVDCIPFGEVPSVRAARAAGAAAVADHGPRLSGFEPRPQRRGFERPPTPGRVVPLLRQGLVDRFGKRLACPDGCVPVARLSVDDMARSGSFDQFFSKIGTRPPAGKKAAGRKAGAKPGTKAGKKAGARVSPRGGVKPVVAPGVAPGGKDGKAVFPSVQGHSYANTVDGNGGQPRPPYFGCSTGLSIRQPTVPNATASISQLWMLGQTMANGLPQTLECGWMVQPGLFGTTSPVLFVFFNPDGYGPQSGYVMNRDSLMGFIPAPDAPFVIGQHGFLVPPAPGSAPVGVQLYWEYFDAPDPGWYLYYGSIGESSANYTFLGYFQARLYAGTTLASNCLNVQFGGEVGGVVPGIDPNPGFIEMGSGTPPSSDALFNFNNVAFQCDTSVQVTKNAHMVEASLSPLQVDSQDGFGLNFPTDPAFASYFFFGGRMTL